MTDQEMRLKFGEMTGQEFRTARAIVDYFERENEQLKDAAELYEVVRRMNPRQFADAYRLNICWGKPFDDVIRALKPFYEEKINERYTCV